MSAFLKLDRCLSCHRALPWEWVPPVEVAGRALAGTGLWRSQLIDDLCASCAESRALRESRERLVRDRRNELVRVLGGARPYREFSFTQFSVTDANRLAFDAARDFEPGRDNLYLWGPCGGGKTHLAIAALRRTFDEQGSATSLSPLQLARRLRMQTPEAEQAAIDDLATVGCLLLDDMSGLETPFARQVIQEVIDLRYYADRAGLIVTSRHSPEALARLSKDPSIASRLVRMCRVVEIRGPQIPPREVGHDA